MKCPVCKTECDDRTICPKCGFHEMGKIFLNREDAEQWMKCVVQPHRNEYRIKTLHRLKKSSGFFRYGSFGLRQDWLDGVINYGPDFFDSIGRTQASALRNWLFDANLIVYKPTYHLSPLGEKLISQLGTSHPLTWAVIWANLAYNSSLVHWYCINVDVGTRFDKSDLSEMMGESASISTRMKGISALTDTFRNSPIGLELGQGVFDCGHKTYLRQGWNSPMSVALLYTFYLYAEKTEVWRVPLEKLLNSHSNHENFGMSPLNIYGIDGDHLKEKILELECCFPWLINRSTAYGMDNIILNREYSSNSIIDLA